MKELPVACTLGPAALAARKEALLAQLLQRAERCEALADGYRLTFAATDETLVLIARAVAVERRCCEFLRFQITVEPSGGPVCFDLTGPAGTRQFLAALLDA